MAQKTILIPGEVVDRAIDAQAEGKDARESIDIGFYDLTSQQGCYDFVTYDIRI